MLSTAKPNYAIEEKVRSPLEVQIPTHLLKHSHIRVIQEKSDAIHVQFTEDDSAADVFSLYTFFEGRKTLHVSGAGAVHPVSLAGESSVDEDEPHLHAAGSPVYVQQDIPKIIAHFLTRGATDIHFNPRESDTEVCSRVDGFVCPSGVIISEEWRRIVVQLKMRAELDVAETRRPQSGSFVFEFEGRSVDIRVSTHPAIHGERIVLRLLGEGLECKSLESIGFSHRRIRELRGALMRRQGVFLITGPTGSGKTTTLYALIEHLYKQGVRSILTLEDPVEYKTPYIVQSNVNPATGFTYAKGIKSILRQDPEVMLLGEIRDEETAKMAYRAALTGVLVLATVHAGSVHSVAARLMDLGVSLSQFVGQTTGILNQRLVRKRCECEVGSCAKCNDTQYAGRTALEEFVLMPSYYGKQHLVQTSDNLYKWMTTSQEEGLLDRVWSLLASGRTTFSEVQRVLGPIASFVDDKRHDVLSCN